MDIVEAFSALFDAMRFEFDRAVALTAAEMRVRPEGVAILRRLSRPGRLGLCDLRWPATIAPKERARFLERLQREGLIARPTPSAVEVTPRGLLYLRAHAARVAARTALRRTRSRALKDAFSGFDDLPELELPRYEP